MKKLLLLLIIPFLSFGQIVATEDCNSIPDPGICLAYFQTFYFDQTTSQCEESYWGGCGGVVPFWTLEDCQNSCENIETCDPLYDCGPPLGMPNYFCNDSITLAGPGDCIMNENGECFWEIIYCPEEIGCTDPLACNYNPSAIVGNFDDGSCLYEGGTCILVVDDYCSCCSGPCDGICPYELLDSLYGENWFCFYDVPDLSYQEGQILVSGFINENCECITNEIIGVISGCTDPYACNYDDLATEDDGSCEYPDLGYDCSGNCLEDLDDDGLCDSACPFMIFETEDCDCVFDPATYTVYYYDVDEVGCITYEMCYCECYNDSDEDGICDENENNTQIEELSNTKQRIKIIDILGRETSNNKGFQLHIYDDGSVEKKYLIK